MAVVVAVSWQWSHTFTWKSHDSHQPVTWPTPDSHMTYTWQSHELQQMVTWSTSTYLHTFVCHLAHCTMVSQLFLITWSFCCGLNWCFSTKCWNNWQCPHRAAIKIQLAAPACREGGRSPSKRIATKPLPQFILSLTWRKWDLILFEGGTHTLTSSTWIGHHQSDCSILCDNNLLFYVVRAADSGWP